MNYIASGRLRHRIDGLGGRPGLVAPAVLHQVDPYCPMRLFVKFHRTTG
ncbi:hypothetical protein WME99_00765 [Sorangium sp. So ce136]